MVELRIGGKLKMDGEKQRYTVQGMRGRYIIATKPFNARKTYLYTLIDMDEKIRGPINAIFGIWDAVNTPEGAARLLAQMEEEGGWGVSHRRYKPLTEAEIAQLA